MYWKDRVSQLSIRWWPYFRELIPFQGPYMTPEELAGYGDYTKQVISKTYKQALKDVRKGRVKP